MLDAEVMFFAGTTSMLRPISKSGDVPSRITERRKSVSALEVETNLGVSRPGLLNAEVNFGDCRIKLCQPEPACTVHALFTCMTLWAALFTAVRGVCARRSVCYRQRPSSCLAASACSIFILFFLSFRASSATIPWNKRASLVLCWLFMHKTLCTIRCKVCARRTVLTDWVSVDVRTRLFHLPSPVCNFYLHDNLL